MIIEKLALGLAFSLAVSAAADSPAQHYQMTASAGTVRRGLAVLVPGSSGLEIFGDRDHYPAVAGELRQRGFDTLLLDYKAAYAAAEDPPPGSTADKIAWVIEDALGWARAQAPNLEHAPVVLFAWSLGGEGALRLLGDEARARDLRLAGAVLFYPSCRDSERLSPNRPTLALLGGFDTVTPAADFLAKVDPDDPHLQTVVLEGAQHGFDIRSLTKPRKVREFLLLGKAHTFAYHEPAARDASKRWQEFLMVLGGSD